jgi:hypothetical protein
LEWLHDEEEEQDDLHFDPLLPIDIRCSGLEKDDTDLLEALSDLAAVGLFADPIHS